MYLTIMLCLLSIFVYLFGKGNKVKLISAALLIIGGASFIMQIYKDILV